MPLPAVGFFLVTHRPSERHFVSEEQACMQPAPETRIAPLLLFQLHGDPFLKTSPGRLGVITGSFQLERWLLFLMSWLKGNKKEDMFVLLLERKQRTIL